MQNTIMINIIKVLNDKQIKISETNKWSQVLTKIDYVKEYNYFVKYKGEYYG